MRDINVRYSCYVRIRAGIWRTGGNTATFHNAVWFFDSSKAECSGKMRLDARKEILAKRHGQSEPKYTAAHSMPEQASVLLREKEA